MQQELLTLYPVQKDSSFLCDGSVSMLPTNTKRNPELILLDLYIYERHAHQFLASKHDGAQCPVSACCMSIGR